jgi:hypothetical protein
LDSTRGGIGIDRIGLASEASISACWTEDLNDDLAAGAKKPSQAGAVTAGALNAKGED